MWIKRTPDEVAKWHETSAREARAHGRLIGGMIWVLGSLFAAGGWYVGFQSGVLIQFNRGGTYWGRLVLSSLALFPISYWWYRRETNGELGKTNAGTVCPK